MMQSSNQPAPAGALPTQAALAAAAATARIQAMEMSGNMNMLAGSNLPGLGERKLLRNRHLMENRRCIDSFWNELRTRNTNRG